MLSALYILFHLTLSSLSWTTAVAFLRHPPICFPHFCQTDHLQLPSLITLDLWLKSLNASPRCSLKVLLGLGPTYLSSPVSCYYNAPLIHQIVGISSSYTMSFCASFFCYGYFCQNAVLLFLSHPWKMTDMDASFEAIVTYHFLPKSFTDHFPPHGMFDASFPGSNYS